MDEPESKEKGEGSRSLGSGTSAIFRKSLSYIFILNFLGSVPEFSKHDK